MGCKTVAAGIPIIIIFVIVILYCVHTFLVAKNVRTMHRIMLKRGDCNNNKQLALRSRQQTCHREAEDIETSAREIHHCIPCRSHLG